MVITFSSRPPPIGSVLGIYDIGIRVVKTPSQHRWTLLNVVPCTKLPCFLAATAVQIKWLAHGPRFLSMACGLGVVVALPLRSIFPLPAFLHLPVIWWAPRFASVRTQAFLLSPSCKCGAMVTRVQDDRHTRMIWTSVL